MRSNFFIVIGLAGFLLGSCKKNNTGTVKPPDTSAHDFVMSSYALDDVEGQANYVNTSRQPKLSFRFTNKLDRTTVAASFLMYDGNGNKVALLASYKNSDSIVLLQPANSLTHLNKYSLQLTDALKAADGGKLLNSTSFNIITGIDSADKYSRISDDALLDLVQSQTLKYFWDFGHPVSGLARERNTSGDIVTTGGSGFGIMAMISGMHRNFITRSEGLSRVQKIVSFLQNKAQRFHGAYPHWLNGATGVVQPFSTKDNGADLVETSYLMMGLLSARQYFNGVAPEETVLRDTINMIYDAVEWDFFRKNNSDVLYWHWSPTYSWDMNLPLRGWNECLITYIMAASSKTHGIPKSVYDVGWAQNGAIKTPATLYGYAMPFATNYGGPLFFSHYTFTGIDPRGLSDAYGNYQTQVTNHSLINFEYAKANPKKYFGYSASCWGLTASDIPNGYAACSPANDLGVIAPTAALSSFPYTPTQSMQALKFYYYTIGDKLFKNYGFIDAFSLSQVWFADSFLAIDQGPIIVMIENYRSGLLWQLFTSCPEVKTGMRSLGFSASYL